MRQKILHYQGFNSYLPCPFSYVNGTRVYGAHRPMGYANAADITHGARSGQPFNMQFGNTGFLRTDADIKRDNRVSFNALCG